jgi:hypothetical protein
MEPNYKRISCKIALPETKLSLFFRSVCRQETKFNDIDVRSEKACKELVEQKSSKNQPPLSTDQISDLLKEKWKTMTAAQRKPFYVEAERQDR